MWVTPRDKEHVIWPKIFPFVCYTDASYYQIITKYIYVFNHKGKSKRYPHYRPWRPIGDVDARIHIFAATTLEEVRWLALRSSDFTSWKAPVPIWWESEWNPGPDSTRTSEEKSLPLRRQGSNRVVQPLAKRLAAWATWSTIFNLKVIVFDIFVGLYLSVKLYCVYIKVPL